jgi:hypothetical protein
MTEQAKNKNAAQRGDQKGSEPTGKPSQAEGDRTTVEQDLGEQASSSQRPTPGVSGKPSQAEGDRATVEQDLREKQR